MTPGDAVLRVTSGTGHRCQTATLLILPRANREGGPHFVRSRRSNPARRRSLRPRVLRHALDCLASLAMTDGRGKNERKGSGTPTDVFSQPPHLAGAAARAFARARLSAFHRDVFLEMSEHLRPASGHASWDAAATITLLSGRYPPLPVPVQCAPHGRPCLPAADAQSRPEEVCETARGHRTRSVCRIASGYVPK